MIGHDSIIDDRDNPEVIDRNARPVLEAERPPQKGETISPAQVENMEFELYGWAVWVYKVRQNLRVSFGRRNKLTTIQKVMVAIVTATTGVVGWITGVWQYLADLVL